MKDNKNFTDYLEDQCMELHPEVLDDDLQDFFENWIANLDTEALIGFADSYAQQQYEVALELGEVKNAPKV